MKQKIFVLAGLIAAAMLLTGCRGGGGSTSGGILSGDGVEVAGLLGGGDDGGILGGGADGGSIGGDAAIPQQPEPATIALVGGGLVAYAFLRRRKQK